ncbi:hypothetical protein BE04_34050 [Sorangium cellulosum]|uniref:Uncharacterized protein n=1 Tax=Sorangium cellulosum TaxID=56 RepID=A0A150PI22_SORCE|nr:hypothetical protein BE04_34050 [Sorangium cellulosum]
MSASVHRARESLPWSIALSSHKNRDDRPGFDDRNARAVCRRVDAAFFGPCAGAVEAGLANKALGDAIAAAADPAAPRRPRVP